MRTSLGTRFAAALMLVLLPAPLIVVIGASFSPRTVLSFPPPGFSLRWFSAFLNEPAWLNAFAVSLVIAVCAAILTTTAAVGAALALQHAPTRVRTAVETLILAPLLFPHAAIGIGFLGWLALINLHATIPGILLAHLVLCTPFAYRPVAVALRQVDASLTEAALILGAEPRQALTRVVLPLLRPGIAAALMFSFITSFDEVTVTMFLIGPELTTLPVAIYSHVADSADPVVAAISTVLITLTAGLVWLLDRLVGLQIFTDVEEEGRTAA